MVILGIETSCDETAAAVVSNTGKSIQILSNVVASSSALQAKYGGIIPEQAAREQIKSIIPVIETAINDSGLKIKDIDAIAVTYGPGLIGSLLVGVETAKTLALLWHKPLIPINHLIGHFYANWISPSVILSGAKNLKTSLEIATSLSAPRNGVPKFPCIGLLVSGGHTDLVLFQDHNKYEYLGGTRDDAAGECFDKCARLLGLPYPGGPEISKLALKGDPTKFKLTVPMQHSKDLDFSFSGLKTAVANIIRSDEILVRATEVQPVADSQVIRAKRLERPDQADEEALVELANLAASIEKTIIISLIEKTVAAAQRYNVGQIIVAGGVAANPKLKLALQKKTEGFSRVLHIPPPELCTDNGAMIASAGFFTKERIDPLKLQADPNLSLS